MTGSSLAYRAYWAATTLFQPAAGVLLARRLARGKEDGARLGERSGRAVLPRPAGPLVWMHGASVGEALAVLPLITRFSERGVAVLLTTGTVTSAAILAGRLPPGALHQFIPLDTPLFARRFLRHWRPDLALFVESELWPNLLVETARQGVPLALVNARMSRRSFARWRRMPAFIRDLLGCTTLCLAQTREDAERLQALGAQGVSVSGNLKFDAAPAPAQADTLAALRAAIGGRPVWLAASTHIEEEALILATADRLRAHRPDLLTIIVPRQAGRGPALAAAAQARGATARLHSRSERPEAGTTVFVGDTMGELGLFLRLARLVFVGKSLAGGGGQNPIEPAKIGCAILHGPAVANFQAVYALLDEAGGARCVADAEDLATALGMLLDAPAQVAAMARAAEAAIAAEAGATARTAAALDPLLGILPAARG